MRGTTTSTATAGFGSSHLISGTTEKLAPSLATVPRSMNRPDDNVIHAVGAVPHVVGVSLRWCGSIPHHPNTNPSQLFW